MTNKFDKGIELLKSGNYVEAIQVFNSHIQEFPNDANAISERGVGYMHLDKKTESMADMDKALELEPKKSYRYSSRAYVRSYFGDLEGGIEDYKKAIELDPEDAIAHNNLGLLEEKLGYKEQSKKSFELADTLNGNPKVDGRTDLGVNGTPLPTRNIQKEIEKENSTNSISKTMLSVFSKEGFNSFLKFIKSGFKNT